MFNPELKTFNSLKRLNYGSGRKKTNPVWEFFTDLRSFGFSGVRCRFCSWQINDRSPTTLISHLRGKHNDGPGSLFALLDEKERSYMADYAVIQDQNRVRKENLAAIREFKKRKDDLAFQAILSLISINSPAPQDTIKTQVNYGAEETPPVLSHFSSPQMILEAGSQSEKAMKESKQPSFEFNNFTEMEPFKMRNKFLELAEEVAAVFYDEGSCYKLRIELKNKGKVDFEEEVEKTSWTDFVKELEETIQSLKK